MTALANQKTGHPLTSHHRQEITFLPERDAVKRTQTAYVDMCTRDAAVQASYSVGSIFGLQLAIQLAVPRETQAWHKTRLSVDEGGLL